MTSCPYVGPWPTGGVPPVEVFLRDPNPYLFLPRVSEKTTENSKRLSRHGRPAFELGTSRLPVLSATTPSLVGQRELGVQMRNNSPQKKGKQEAPEFIAI